MFRSTNVPFDQCSIRPMFLRRKCIRRKCFRRKCRIPFIQYALFWLKIKFNENSIILHIINLKLINFQRNCNQFLCAQRDFSTGCMEFLQRVRSHTHFSVCSTQRKNACLKTRDRNKTKTHVSESGRTTSRTFSFYTRLLTVEA